LNRENRRKKAGRKGTKEGRKEERKRKERGKRGRKEERKEQVTEICGSIKEHFKIVSSESWKERIKEGGTKSTQRNNG